MGCGSTSVKMDFTIHIMELQLFEKPGYNIIKQISFEIFTMLEKTTVIQYMYDCPKDEFKKMFLQPKKLKTSIFFMVFDNNKTTFTEYIDASGFIPKDEYSYYNKGNSPVMLKKVYVIQTFNFGKIKQEPYNLLKQIDGKTDLKDLEVKCIDPNAKAEDQPIIENKVKTPEPEVIKEKDPEPDPEPDIPDSSDSDNSLIDPETDNNVTWDVKNELVDKKIDELEKIISDEKDDKCKLVSTSISFTTKLQTQEGLEKLNKSLSLLAPNDYKSYSKKKNKIFNKRNDKNYFPLYLQTFSFTDNNFGKEPFHQGWEDICNFLKSKFTPNKNYLDLNEQEERKFRVLRNLDLSMNKIDDDTCAMVMNSLKKVRLHSLNLSSNNITKEGTKDIALWLGKNKSLKELFLQQNSKTEFGIDSIKILSGSFIKHKKLLHINLSNIDLTNTGSVLFEIISKSKLEKIILRDCKFNSKDIMSICNACSNNTDNSSKNYTNNKITNNLRHIDLSENNEEKDGSKIIEIIKLFTNKNKIRNIVLDKFNFHMNQDILLESLNIGLKINPEKSVSRNSIETEIDSISLLDNNIDAIKFISYFYSHFKEENSMLGKDVDIIIGSDKKISKEVEEVLEKFKNLHTPLTIHV